VSLAICLARSQVTELVATTKGKFSVFTVFSVAVAVFVIAGLIGGGDVVPPQAVMVVAIAIMTATDSDDFTNKFKLFKEFRAILLVLL
jgi:hypothetical protein